MKDQMLLQVTEVIDDNTGIWHVGEIEFGISANLNKYLSKYGEEGRDKILEVLDYLKWAVEKRPIVNTSETTYKHVHPNTKSTPSTGEV